MNKLKTAKEWFLLSFPTLETQQYPFLLEKTVDTSPKSKDLVYSFGRNRWIIRNAADSRRAILLCSLFFC